MPVIGGMTDESAMWSVFKAVRVCIFSLRWEVSEGRARQRDVKRHSGKNGEKLKGE